MNDLGFFPPQASRPAVFIVRDSLLCQEHSEGPFLWAPGVTEAVQLLAGLGLPVFVIGTAPDHGEAETASFEQQLTDLFTSAGATLTQMLWCPHAQAPAAPTRCNCRRYDDLLQWLRLQHNLDLPECWVIGDLLDDIEAGRRAGCSTVLLDNGREQLWERNALRRPHHCVRNLAAAVRHLQSGLVAPEPVQIARV